MLHTYFLFLFSCLNWKINKIDLHYIFSALLNMKRKYMLTNRYLSICPLLAAHTPAIRQVCTICMKGFLNLRKVEIKPSLICHTHIYSNAYLSSLQKVESWNHSVQQWLDNLHEIAKERKTRKCGVYRFPQSQFLLHYRWITNIKNHVIIVYIVPNYAIGCSYCIVACYTYVVRGCKFIIIKIAIVHDCKTNFIGNHSMWPKVFICCRYITIKSQKWIPNLP